MAIAKKKPRSRSPGTTRATSPNNAARAHTEPLRAENHDRHEPPAPATQPPQRAAAPKPTQTTAQNPHTGTPAPADPRERRSSGSTPNTSASSDKSHKTRTQHPGQINGHRRAQAPHNGHRSARSHEQHHAPDETAQTTKLNS
jgi:hypothetical protein